jgi:hypothetical protein
VFRSSGYFFLGLFGLAVLAFWPMYVSQLSGGGISGYVHVHAAAMTLWFGLLIAQPFLLHAGRRSLHRALGKLSYAVVPVAVVAAILVSHAALRRDGAADFASAGSFVYMPLSMTVLFAATYGLAIAFRDTPAVHARWMICSSFAVLDPILGRVLAFNAPPLPHPLYYQLISYVLSAVVLLALIVAERRRRRPQLQGRVVFPAMLGALTVVYGLWFTLGQSSTWLGVARWFHDLPLT